MQGAAGIKRMNKPVNKPTAERKLIIAVIGSGQCTAEEAVVAETVGRELARRGITVVCGGLGGIMEAACKGAAIEAGTTIGILPHDDPHMANQYVHIPIATGIGHARNISVVNTAEAVIAISGSYGTLSEIAHALISGIPVIGLNTWSISQKGQEESPIIEAEDAIDAVEKAVAMARKLFRWPAE